FCAYLEKGQLVEMGTSATQWLPTSSMRTLFNRDAQFMLKFSLNVKLTNSLRNLLAHELDRGLMLHEAYATQAGQELARSLPEFELIHEPVFAGLLDKNGELIAESLLLGRYNPFQEESQIGLLATLTMDQIEFKENLIHQCIQTRSHSNAKDLKNSSHDWFKAFLDVAISPLIIA